MLPASALPAHLARTPLGVSPAAASVSASSLSSRLGKVVESVMRGAVGSAGSASSSWSCAHVRLPGERWGQMPWHTTRHAQKHPVILLRTEIVRSPPLSHPLRLPSSSSSAIPSFVYSVLPAFGVAIFQRYAAK